MKKVFLFLIAVTLSACSNGGGSGGQVATFPSVDGGGNPIYGCTDSMAINFNPSATQDDSTCQYSGGPGGMGYSGFNLADGAEVSNRSATALLTSHKGIANVFALDTSPTKLTSNDLDALVYQPTCIDGSDYATRVYNLVLISSSITNSTAPTTATMSLEFFNSNAKFSGTTLAGIVTPFSFSWSEPSPTVASWTCNNGRFEITGNGVAYSNSKAIVIKRPTGEIYFGFLRDDAVNVHSWSSANPIQTVSYQESGGMNWHSGGTFNSNFGEIFTPSTDSMMPNNFVVSNNSCPYSGGSGLSLVSVASDAASSGYGPLCLKIPNDTGSNPIVGKSILSTGTNAYRGTIVSIGGKKVGVFAGHHAGSQGSDAYSFLIEE